MQTRLTHWALIGCIAAVVMFTNLGNIRLWDRDEPRNAGAAAEMLARGDWVVPVFNDELRTHKPVLLYWLMMSAYGMFGVNEFAARFWSAGLAVGTCLATYQIGRRLFSPAVGCWAAVMLSTSLMFGVAGRAATPDSALIFFSTVALAVFVTATFDRSKQNQAVAYPRHWLSVAFMFAIMSVGVLAKGPVGLVVPTAVIGMYLLIRRLPPPSITRAERNSQPCVTRIWLYVCRGAGVWEPRHFFKTCWSMRPLTAFAMVALVAVPWYVLVGFRTDGQWLRGFFLDHNLGRATQSLEGHKGSLLFYPFAILIGFFPWSIFAVPTTLDGIRRVQREDQVIDHQAYVFLWCWVGVSVGLFSIAKTKLPSYVTPCYPALAVLTGAFVDRLIRRTALTAAWWPQVGFTCCGTVGLVFLVALPFAAERWFPGEAWLSLLGLIPLIASGVALVLYRRQRVFSALTTMAVAAVALTTSLFGFATVTVDRHQQSHVLLRTINRHSGNPTVGSFGVLEPSWVFYGERPIWELSGSEQENTAGGPWQPKPNPPLLPFLTKKDHFVITTRSILPRLGDLPSSVEVLAEVPLFFKTERLVLLGQRRAKDHADLAGQPPAARILRR